MQCAVFPPSRLGGINDFLDAVWLGLGITKAPCFRQSRLAAVPEF